MMCSTRNNSSGGNTPSDITTSDSATVSHSSSALSMEIDPPSKMDKTIGTSSTLPQQNVSSSTRYMLSPSTSATSSDAAKTPAGNAFSVFSQFQDLQSQVVDLNHRGMELFAMKKYQSSLFHFNEAFRLLTSTGSSLLDDAVEVDPDEFRRIGDDQPSSLFGRKPMPPTDLMLPLEPINQGVPRSVDDVQGWVLLASMILMINGALGHLQRGKLENAEQLLRMAIALSDDEDDRENPDDAQSEEERFELLRRQYHVKMILMSVYFVLGQVQSKARTDSGDVKEEKLSEGRMRECMVSFTESLSLAGDLLGKHHFTLALIYVTIGQVLLREGYFRGASVSFRHAEEIYNRPRAAFTMPSLAGSDPSVGGGGSSPPPQDPEMMSNMSDLEVASMLLGVPFSHGAPVA